MKSDESLKKTIGLRSIFHTYAVSFTLPAPRCAPRSSILNIIYNIFFSLPASPSSLDYQRAFSILCTHFFILFNSLDEALEGSIGLFSWFGTKLSLVSWEHNQCRVRYMLVILDNCFIIIFFNFFNFFRLPRKKYLKCPSVYSQVILRYLKKSPWINHSEGGKIGMSSILTVNYL